MYCAESPWFAGPPLPWSSSEGVARLERNPRAELALRTRDHRAYVRTARDTEAVDRAAEQVEPLCADDLEPELALQRRDLIR